MRPLPIRQPLPPVVTTPRPPPTTRPLPTFRPAATTRSPPRLSVFVTQPLDLAESFAVSVDRNQLQFGERLVFTCCVGAQQQRVAWLRPSPGAGYEDLPTGATQIGNALVISTVSPGHLGDFECLQLSDDAGVPQFAKATLALNPFSPENLPARMNQC